MVDVMTTEEVNAKFTVLEARIKALETADLPQAVKDALKIVLEYFLTELTPQS